MAVTTGPAIVATQFSEWRACVGKSNLGRLRALLGASIEQLQRWAPPTAGFVPTLRLVKPPLPTWTEPAPAAAALTAVRGSMAMASDAAGKTAYLPRAVESALRLISLLWELFAYPSTSSSFFARGRLRLGLIGDVVGNEQVNASYASWVMREWAQQLALGANYRNAVARVEAFRGDDVEDLDDRIRHAARHLSAFSVTEILAVASEQLSPTFDTTRWRLVDQTRAAVGSARFAEFVGATTAVVDLALDSAVPLILDLRSGFGLNFAARPSALGEFLRVFRCIRRWDVNPNASTLVLTHEHVAHAGADAVRMLKGLSGSPLLTYGRMSRAATAAHGYGQRAVFQFDARELANALGEDVEVIG
jgi:hypothetical protein